MTINSEQAAQTTQAPQTAQVIPVPVATEIKATKAPAEPKAVSSVEDAAAFLQSRREGKTETNSGQDTDPADYDNPDDVEAAGLDDDAAPESDADVSETGDQNEKDKPEGRWQKIQRQKREAIAERDKYKSQLSEMESNADELIEHATFFADRNKQLANENGELLAEVERLRSRLQAVDLPEYGSDAERQMAEIVKENMRLKSFQAQQEAEARAAQDAAKQKRAQSIAFEIETLAKNYGLEKEELGKAAVAAISARPGMTLEQVAKNLSMSVGAKKRSDEASRQAQHNQSAPRPAPNSGGGSTSSAQNFGMNSPDGPVNFLRSLRKAR